MARSRIFRICLVLFIFLSFSNSQLHAQYDHISLIKFNVASGNSVKNDVGGLVVSGVAKITKELEDKKRFIFNFTLTNGGTKDIALYDWEFRAICPENNMGQKWQENSSILLTTPFIESGTFIVLKPGEKKSFSSAETDFYWCLPKNPGSIKTDPPSYFSCVIQCNTLATGKTASPFDAVLQDLIKEHRQLIASGKLDEAAKTKSYILEIGQAMYPERIEELKDLISVKASEPESPEPISTKPKTSSGTTQSGYSEWLFLQSDKALQYRMSFVKEEGEFGYIQLEVRLNKEDPIYCRNANCEGYIWYLNYDDEYGNSKSHYFYIANSFEGIYQLSFLIPFKKSKPNGVQQYWSESKKRVVVKASNSKEEIVSKFLYNCVDNKMKNNAVHRCNHFKMEKAIIIK